MRIRTILVALFWVLLFWFLNHNVGFDFADEGFYWYGVDAVRRGEVPVRDFQAYMPGRYYWGAFFARFFGSGPVGLRAGAAVFQWLALSFGLSAAGRVIRSWAGLIGLGALCLPWMLLPFRFFEAGLPLIAVYFAMRLAEEPFSVRRHFEAGVFTGVACFFGLQHGAYVWAAMQALIVFLWLRLEKSAAVKKNAAYYGGLAAGSSPFLFFAVFAPGFAGALAEEIRFIFETGLTRIRLPLPVPWPWTVRWQDVTAISPDPAFQFLEYVNRQAIGWTFVAVPLFLVWAWIWLGRTPRTELQRMAPAVGAIFVGTIYARHYFPRAELAYLGEGLEPLLLAAALFAALFWFHRHRRGAVLLCVTLGVLTFGAAGLRQVFLYKLLAAPYLEKVKIRQDVLQVERSQAQTLKALKTWGAEHLKGDLFFAAPLVAAFYPILDKPSPVSETYFAHPLSEKRQRQIIEELERKKVAWAVLADAAIDGRQELLFSKTHARLWDYLMKNFKVWPMDGLPPGYRLYRRVEA